ncbi:Mor transcription activator family protein [Pseudomonas fluorescens]|uniref:Mor transcription activator family protein n=1 Tax=Pseudomonas fluorescens TaxID=294 RepID=UPI00177CDA3E|nr:Mor transcription activator family protein [Pseudomonas fluorescens]
MNEEEEQSKKGKRVPSSVWEGTALELFKSVESSIAHALEQGSTPEHLASEVITGLSKYFGGRVIYIPKGFRYDREQRNKEIYCAWKNNVSISDLSKKHGLTSATTYEIVANFAKEEGLKKSKNRFIK